MNRTVKALGLGLLAALAISAFAVVGASANINAHAGGHFTVDGNPTFPVKLHGHSNQTHRLHTVAFGTSVTCTETYTGQVNAATVTSITITIDKTNCEGGRIIRNNGCDYTFTFRDTSVSTLHNDVHFTCPLGKKLEIESPGECVITYGPQTITNAVTYTTIINEFGKHALTIDFTMGGTVYEKHGLCEFVAPFGTGPHTGAELKGSATLSGTDANGIPTGITATGTNGH